MGVYGPEWILLFWPVAEPKAQEKKIMQKQLWWKWGDLLKWPSVQTMVMSDVVARRRVATAKLSHTGFGAKAHLRLGRYGSTTRRGTAWCPFSVLPTTPSWGEICQQGRTPASTASLRPITPSTSPRSSSPMLPCELSEKSLNQPSSAHIGSKRSMCCCTFSACRAAGPVGWFLSILIFFFMIVCRGESWLMRQRGSHGVEEKRAETVDTNRTDE